MWQMSTWHHYSSTNSSSSNNNNNTTTNRHLDVTTIDKYRHSLTQLLQNYHTKSKYEQENVRHTLRTHFDFVNLSLLLLSSPQENTNVVHTIFQNVEVESLLQLRVHLEHDSMVQDYEHPVTMKGRSQPPTENVATVQKRWTQLLTTVLLKSMNRHVVARRIQPPTDAANELVPGATVHVELPGHYNDQYNPFVGRDRRVYGVYRIPMPVEAGETTTTTTTTTILDAKDPIVILCVSLQPKIPRSLRQIFCAAPTPLETTVATFYSIVNVQSQRYSQLKLGEYLIHAAVKMLLAESSSSSSSGGAHYHHHHHSLETTTEPTSGTPPPVIDTFVTLSPMPGFRTWVSHEMDLCTNPDHSHDTATTTGPGVIRSHPALYHTVQFLSRQWACPESEVLSNIIQYLSTRSDRERVQPPPSNSHPQPTIPIDGIETFPPTRTPNSAPQIQAAIRYFLEGMGAHYIVHSKIGETNGTSIMSTIEPTKKPTNGVARFHLQNGAQVYRINAFADLSLTGISNSLGVMVNYRYDLSQLRQNQAQYEKNYTIATHDYVKQQLQ